MKTSLSSPERGIVRLVGSFDNWAEGALSWGIDLGSGRLRTDGLYKPGYGARVQQHLQTQVIFLEFDVPILVRQLRSHVSSTPSLGIHSIGWDIAVTSPVP